MGAAPQPTFEDDFVFATDRPFALAGGGSLQPVTLRHAGYGALNARRDNVILVCHALSGSARVADWWPEMFGPGRPFDTERFCVLGSNVLGSCYGSTGPGSVNPRTGQPYGADFPIITVCDAARPISLRAARIISGHGLPTPNAFTPLAATCCLRSIMSSIFSSTVPAQTNLCTCTHAVWPMR